MFVKKYLDENIKMIIEEHEQGFLRDFKIQMENVYKIVK